MKALIEYIAASLVDDPAAVRVREAADGHGTRIELRVARADLGKVIGREGRTARAVRALLAVSGRKQRRAIGLEILE
jgi:predicted RNA-binding protein YlqC (UPF0109 family)